jgi:predicted nucleic acid-binding protein
MVPILDTSGLLAAMDSDQSLHEAAGKALAGAVGPSILSPFVLAELDYLLAERVGQEQELAFPRKVERGTYRLEPFSARNISEARAAISRHADSKLGLADASNVVLAGQYGTHDERHFRTVIGPRDLPFRLLPANL